MKNVCFRYVYRDAANYKNHGEAVFSNREAMSEEEIKRKIRAALYDGVYFIADQVDVEDKHFGVPDGPDDHPWHEFVEVDATDKRAGKRDIANFIGDLERANRDGWKP